MRPTRQQWRKRKYRGISAHFSSSGQFRCVSTVSLFRTGTRWMSFFFPEYFRYLHIFIFGVVLDDHDSANFSLQDHPSLLLPPFNRADSLGGLSFLFLFSFQRATSCFLYILERQSHFILKWDKFLFFGQKGERIGSCTSTELTFLFFFKASDGSCVFTVHHQVLTLDVVQSLLWRFIYINFFFFSFSWCLLWRFIYIYIYIFFFFFVF